MTCRTCIGFACALVLLLGSCGGDQPVNPGTGEPQAVAAAPTKDALIGVLRDLNKALDAEDYAGALVYWVAFPGMTVEAMTKGMEGFQEKQEISAAGIDILAEKGTFGPLLEVFPERGGYFATKAGVDAAACYALAYEGAEVAAHWDGKTLRLIRIDDVGKLR